MRFSAFGLAAGRRLQPAFDVEQHPRAVRMLADRLEHQLPINTVEVGLDVEIERPVVAPAALTSRARHRSQTCRVCSHRSRGGTPAPRSAPGNVGRLPGRLGRRQLEYPTAERPHHPALEFRPAAPAEESNSLTTIDSKVYRGCLLDQPRTPQSTAHLLRPLRGWPSHS